MSTRRKVQGKRSFTGNHPLLPAMRPTPASTAFIPKVPTYTFLKWTFGRGSVIWKIWPAVVLHSSFAAAVVFIWTMTESKIDVPNVMLTVMGVVIGFVISYRAISGYDRYWMGRTAWSDVIRNARTMGRLVWYHVPPRLTGGVVSPIIVGEQTAEERERDKERERREAPKVMAEKRMALDLVEAFAVALKHHLRGELGIYYEDLYDLVRPLHDREFFPPHWKRVTYPTNPQFAIPAAHFPVAAVRPATPTPTPTPSTLAPPSSSSTSASSSAVSTNSTLKPTTHAARRPAYSTPAQAVLTQATAGDAGTGTGAGTGSLNLGSIDAHSSASLVDGGATDATGATASSSSVPTGLGPSSNLANNENNTNNNPSTVSLPHQPLLPAMNPAPEDGVLRRVSPDVIPFAGVFSGVARWLGSWGRKDDFDRQKHRDRSSRRQRAWSGPMRSPSAAGSGPIHPAGVAKLEEVEMGENLPEEVLRCLSEWFSVLEARQTVPGTSLGAMIAGIQTFEASLTTLEQVLTTPLPFVYSVHIRVVWLYLFLLPLQLVGDFQWHTVPAVSVGAFVYLGFVAAGEEIEQPFGYDDNDLDMDMFCRDIIRTDIQCLKKARCLNAWFPPAPVPTVHLQRSATATSTSTSSSTSSNLSLGPAIVVDTSTSTSANANIAIGASLLSPETVPPHIEFDVADSDSDSDPYGGNMYRASLSSLADSVSLEDVEEYEYEEDEESQEDGSGAETERETQGHGNGDGDRNANGNGNGNEGGHGQGEGTVQATDGGVREGQLVDVR
ncbi:Bestrophin, RFP-TM, chloride channel-domain-containing protein [Mycena crocata]|nr:Bestrophin, RFP-TM, chloride channel-domain-containing protein [Mycena crocata]